MAKRPVFILTETPPFFSEVEIEFAYSPGFAVVQKQKCIDSLHEQFQKYHPDQRVLEISSKSKDGLGVSLSAFNLMIELNNKGSYSIEVAFQSSKVFEHGGPYKDLLTKGSKDAKKDPRLKTSGKLLYFDFGNRRFELSPTTYFYNWLYVNTLHLHPELSSQIVCYDAFTDIEFNPDKSVNCQARSAALFVALYRKGLLEAALKDRNSFLEIVYGNTTSKSTSSKQLSLWD